MAAEGKEVILERMRHSAAHVMAEAVQSLFPEAKFGIGPAIEDGFYYDFELPRTLAVEDLPVIEARMKEIIASDVPFVKEGGKYAVPSNFLLSLVRCVLEEGQCMWRSLLLPVPSVKGLVCSPMPILMPCLPVMPVEVRVLLP